MLQRMSADGMPQKTKDRPVKRLQNPAANLPSTEFQ
jgi:hypothetical protein